MSFNAESTHPYIMNSRIKSKSGGGGGTPYTPPAYSLEEVNTGKKWIDGKPIYTRVINYTGALSTSTTTLASNINYIDNIIDAKCVADNGPEGFSPIVVFIDGTNLKGRTVGNFSSQLLHIVIEYTKPTTP